MLWSLVMKTTCCETVLLRKWCLWWIKPVVKKSVFCYWCEKRLLLKTPIVYLTNLLHHLCKTNLKHHFFNMITQIRCRLEISFPTGSLDSQEVLESIQFIGQIDTCKNYQQSIYYRYDHMQQISNLYTSKVAIL